MSQSTEELLAIASPATRARWALACVRKAVTQAPEGVALPLAGFEVLQFAQAQLDQGGHEVVLASALSSLLWELGTREPTGRQWGLWAGAYYAGCSVVSPGSSEEFAATAARASGAAWGDFREAAVWAAGELERLHREAAGAVLDGADLEWLRATAEVVRG